jgi:hypothetical protein
MAGEVTNSALESAGDDLFVAVSCIFIAAAFEASKRTNGRPVLIQPHGRPGLPSTAKALRFAKKRGRRLVALITPTDSRSGEPQHFAYGAFLEDYVLDAGRDFTAVPLPGTSGLCEVHGPDGKARSWVVTSADDLVYGDETFARVGLVLSGIRPLVAGAPISICENLRPRRGDAVGPCGSVSRAAPKRILPDYRSLLAEVRQPAAMG